MSLLRGRVYDLQQNRIKAAICYQDALRRDVKCYEGAPACLFLFKKGKACAMLARSKAKRVSRPSHVRDNGSSCQ